MLKLSKRVQQVKPSATLAITAKAAALRAQGQDIISLSVGEPEFPTPLHVQEAGIAAIKSGFSKYTAVAGIPELRQAVADKFRQDNGLNYEAADTLVSTGGKQCIYNLMQAMLDDGDEVVIPAPYWVSYPDMALLAGGVPVTVQTTEAEKFKITPQKLRENLTSKTRLLLLCAPSNPTGMSYSDEELQGLGEVLLDFPDVAIASDEMYEKIIFDGKKHACFAAANPALRERTITFNGVSKAHCMTGWRIGFCVGPRHLIQAMTKVQGQSTSNPNSIAQKAALAALQGSTAQMSTMVETYSQRRHWLVNRINGLEGMACTLPDGAFYVFAGISDWLGQRTADGEILNNDVDVCAWLLDVAHVALVPGSAFGTEGYVRFSYAVAQEVLEDALNRIEKAVSTLINKKG
ncbi:MAG: pyridoxal phosphate-dependent aminotransferase [Mariprofundaceae bacterium]|nr:pyridoxal phosphate-dependent aminotransferase [Mariprofundaceae bacterium]